MSSDLSILDDSYNLEQQFKAIEKSLFSFKSQITTLQNQLKTLDKNVKREMKPLKKDALKHKSKGNRKPSGFAKPSVISVELSEFMNKKRGEHVARTEVTQFIINYIKENNLADSKNIKPDNKLKKLLDINDNDEITYFNIQKFMNKHFIKQHTPVEALTPNTPI